MSVVVRHCDFLTKPVGAEAVYLVMRIVERAGRAGG